MCHSNTEQKSQRKKGSGVNRGLALQMCLWDTKQIITPTVPSVQNHAVQLKFVPTHRTLFESQWSSQCLRAQTKYIL